MKQYDYSKLLGKMRERGETQASVAAMLGINPATLYNKLHNKTEFSQSEMHRMCDCLGIASVQEYFFCERSC